MSFSFTLKYLTICESLAIDNCWSKPGSIDGITIIDKLVITMNVIKIIGRILFDSMNGV